MTTTWTDSDDVEYEIDFEYNPGEPGRDYYPDGSGHPGEAPSVLINEISMTFFNRRLWKPAKVILPFEDFSTAELESIQEKCFAAYERYKRDSAEPEEV